MQGNVTWQSGNLAGNRPFRMKMTWVVAVLAASLGGPLAGIPQAAAESALLQQSDRAYPVRILHQPLREVLRDIAAELQVALDLSPGVQGEVVAPPYGLSVGELLRFLEDEFDLYSFYDGMALHVAARAESQSSLVDLQSVSRERLMETLAELKLSDDRFLTSNGVDTGMLMVGGPPAYRLAVERVIRSLAARNAETVIVYRGGAQ